MYLAQVNPVYKGLGGGGGGTALCGCTVDASTNQVQR